MQDLEYFKNHEDEIIRDMAILLEEAKKGRDSGALTEDQFKEIVEDITQVERIEELASDLERKQKVQQAILLMGDVLSLVGIIKKL